jgi:hypothetical protein
MPAPVTAIVVGRPGEQKFNVTGGDPELAGHRLKIRVQKEAAIVGLLTQRNIEEAVSTRMDPFTIGSSG